MVPIGALSPSVAVPVRALPFIKEHRTTLRGEQSMTRGKLRPRPRGTFLHLSSRFQNLPITSSRSPDPILGRSLSWNKIVAVEKKDDNNFWIFLSFFLQNQSALTNG